MRLEMLDWAIVFGSVVALTWFSLRTGKYMQGVADFLAANRSAGRYMLTMATSATGLGAISAVSIFEQYYAAGFPTIWWMWMTVPVGLVITLSGWVYYRFRETRCLTLAQFFEVRYSRRFRIFAGVIVWLSGILNFGIFPYVASNFFVYYCGLPDALPLFGGTIPTYWPIMLITTGLALLYTIIGGQITVMVTDCLQGILCGIGFLILAAFLLVQYPWQDIVQAMQDAPLKATQEDLQRDAELKKLAYDEAVRQGMTEVAEERQQEYERLLETASDPAKLRAEAAGKSMFNPFDTGRVKHFSMIFYMILVFNMFYGAMSWQGSQAYQSSGKSPHEQKMALIIFPWVYAVRLSGLMLISVCALTFLTHPNFAAVSVEAHEIIDNLKAGDTPQLAIQQRVPIALSYMLPTGLRGFFCVMMVFLLITTQDTYMHSWGSIFVQDVVLPFRKNRLTPEQHVKWLRGSVVGVAIFAVIFAALYEPTEFIQMYFAITGAIFSGLGCAIIGGLYWRHGGTFAAYVAVGLGAVLSTARIVMQQFTEQIAAIPNKGSFTRLLDFLNTQVNSQVIWFWIMMVCIGSYVALSLISRREPFDLEKMLHRGKYDTEQEHQQATEAGKATWLKKLGIGKEFTRSDWLLVLALVIWNTIWVATFLVATVVNYFVSPISTEWWTEFWRLWIYTQLGVGIPAMIWFTVGGLQDIRTVFQRLTTLQRDETDDGWIERES